MNAVGSENIVHAIPHALMPPEENTVRVTAKCLKITINLDDPGGDFLMGKSAPVPPSADLTNGDTFGTGF